MEIKFVPSQIAKNNTMSYSSIHKKLENKKTIILDGGMGAELEKNGAKMDEKMWCGKCSVDHPELVRKIHEDYINAGADVITTNTYSTTPISMRQYGYEDSIEKFNKKSVQVAKEAIRLSFVDILAPPNTATEFLTSFLTFDKALSSSSSNRPAQASLEKVITPVVDA